MCEAHIQEAEEIERRFLITSKQPAALLEPADETLDDVSTTIQFAIKIRMPRLGYLPAMGNDRRDIALVEPFTDPLRMECHVTTQVDRGDVDFPVVVGDAGVFQNRGEGRAFVRLPGSHFGVQRVPVAVAEEVDLRRETAAGAAQRVVFRLARVLFFPPPAAHRWARTTVPSMHHNSWSKVSVSVIAALRRSTSSSSVPSELHWLNQVYTVSQGPNSSSGKSRHGAPVRRIHRMPSTICRRSARGRPVLAAGGNTGATHSHCSSVSRCLAIAVSVPGGVKIDELGH